MELNDEHHILAKVTCIDEVAGTGQIEFCTLPPEDMVDSSPRSPLSPSECGTLCQDHIVFEFASGGLHHLPKLLSQCPACVVEGAPKSWLDGNETKDRRDSFLKSRANIYRAYIRSFDFGMLWDRKLYDVFPFYNFTPLCFLSTCTDSDI